MSYAILQRESVAALLVTHDHRAALAWCDKVAIIGQDREGEPGRLHQFDTRSVYHQPQSAVAARLTGEAILLDAEAHGEVATSAFGSLPLATNATGSVQLMIRPETLLFVRDDAGDARVLRRHFEGSQIRVDLQTPQRRLSIISASLDAPDIGAVGRIEPTRPVWPLPTP